MPKLVHRPGVAGQYEPTRPPAPILVIGFLLTLASIGMCSDLAAGVSAFKEKDYSVALAELKPLADGGNASAEYYLGLMLHSGLGLPKNTPLAAELIRRATAKGNAKAQGWMGFAYSNVSVRATPGAFSGKRTSGRE